MATDRLDDYKFPVFGTQGGGICRMVGDTAIWVEPPKDFPEMQVGGEVPEEWGLAPANLQARNEPHPSDIDWEDEDHSDDICPCGDPDCNRPFGHE